MVGVKGHNLGWQRGNGIRLDREGEGTHTGIVREKIERRQICEIRYRDTVFLQYKSGVTNRVV